MSNKRRKRGPIVCFTDSADWLAGITVVLGTVGRAEFSEALFSFLNEFLLIDHFAVFTYTEEQGAEHLFTRSIMPVDEAEGLARDYVNEYHQRDPHFERARTEENRDNACAVHPGLDDEYDADYRQHFFIQHDLVDKVSVTREVDGAFLYCNFYRIGESGQFSAEERRQFEPVLPLVTNLIACHCKLLRLQGTGEPPQANSARSLVHSVISRKVAPFDRLTGRESEVCERILLGFTSTGISLDLGIAQSSVNTYRRRAYEKLAIATQNELFSLCISALNLLQR